MFDTYLTFIRHWLRRDATLLPQAYTLESSLPLALFRKGGAPPRCKARLRRCLNPSCTCLELVKVWLSVTVARLGCSSYFSYLEQTTTMSEQLKFLVEELNKPPYQRNFNLISFDALHGDQLLQVMSRNKGTSLNYSSQPC